MTSADWQQLAEEKLLASASLLAAQNWPSAYYLAGYSVECGLKSCILVRIAANPQLIFDEKRFSEKCWTHEIAELVKLAGLEAILDTDVGSNPLLEQNWDVVKDWNERSRYQMNTQVDAERLYAAITDNADRVLQWIEARW